MEHNHKTKKCKCNVCNNTIKNSNTLNEHIKGEHKVNENDKIWSEYDSEFAVIITSLENDLDDDNIGSAEAGNIFNSLLSNFLESKPDLVKQVRTFYKHKPHSTSNASDAKKLKNKTGKES